MSNEEELEVNMTPMLDIVFIMLIFFIVTAVFVKEAGIDVIRPDADTAKDVKRVSTIIAVSDTNAIWVDKREITLDDVRTVITKLKQENPKGKIVIKADSKSNAGLVVQIVEQLNLIGVAGVAIATSKEGES